VNATAMILAVQLANLESHSALPDAPVVAEPKRRAFVPGTSVARDTARALRRAADRIQPVRTCG
jgi:hypothetical protein